MQHQWCAASRIRRGSSKEPAEHLRLSIGLGVRIYPAEEDGRHLAVAAQLQGFMMPMRRHHEACADTPRGLQACGFFL